MDIWILLRFIFLANVAVSASMRVQPSQDALLAPPRTLDNPHVVEYLAQLDGSGGIRG